MNTLVESIPAKTAQAFLPGTIAANGETSPVLGGMCGEGPSFFTRVSFDSRPPPKTHNNQNLMKTISIPGLIALGALLVTSPFLCASETDDRIESSFSKSYAYKVYLKGDAIKAESRNGVVTLTGQVNEASHKALAQEAVAGLPGVQRVDNRLEIKTLSPPPRGGESKPTITNQEPS